jgi:hypothetical protein
MNTDSTSKAMTRREFAGAAAGIAAAAALPAIFPLHAAAADPPMAAAPKMIGIQISAISFVDEGVDAVLDSLQERGQVNTLFLSTFTYDSGTGGRQVQGRPLPDHGQQEYDKFHGGNFATPHPQFYQDTILKDTKAPDHGDLDILELVLPKTKQRGMKVFAWNYNIFRRDIPNIEKLEEVDFEGERLATCCAYNPDYRNFVLGLMRDHCTSYDIDGVMWGSEHQGPLNNALTSRPKWNPPRSGCFCEFHRQAAKERGIDVERAIEGYKKLDQFGARARAGDRPNDGYFVEFWRLLLDYPEILAWEKLWTDGKHAIYADIHRTVKAVRPELEVGFHIWHENSFSPFYRAEQTYDRFTSYADFIKPVLYNNAAGPRYAAYINGVGSTIFADVPKDQLLELHNHWLNYEEKPLAEIPNAGLSADYVYRETKRALDDVAGKCKIYPGIDVDIPTTADQKQTTPDDVEAATTAALKAGAQGVIFSRKYSEMRLANLAGGGKAVKAFGAADAG